MSQTTFDTTLVPSIENSAATTRRTGGIGQSLRVYLDAMREGLAASRRYDSLRSQGVTHEQALTRALAETGFGS